MAKKKRKQKKVKISLGEKIERFFSEYSAYLFLVSLLFFIILAIKAFQVQISIGEDDSAYILAAKRFLEGKSFPTWHGSFYPIFLAFFMKIIGGINLMFFKALSFVLMGAQLIFLYFAFRRKVPYSILLMSLIFISTNIFILIYSSLTYSEPLYMFFQAAVIWSFMSLYDKIKSGIPHKKLTIYWLMLGLFIFLLSITRNIGWAGIITVILFFAVDKRWKEILLSLGAMAVFYIPYNIYKSTVWNIHQAGFEGQFKAIFLKNPYSPQLGYESFSGFINRFIVNSEQYLSIHLLNMFGLQITKSNIIGTLLVYAAFIFSLIVIWKKKKELLFPVFYIGIGVAVTFITQQTFWNQERLILIYLPLIVIIFFSALYEILKTTKLKNLSFFLLTLVTLFSFSKTIKYIKAYTPIKQRILTQDKYYGLTPDWRHYLQAIEYTGKNIPKDKNIACRKPGIAFLYGGGREFIGIYRFPGINIDTLINELKDEAQEKNYKIIGVVIPNTGKGIKTYYRLYPYFSHLRAFINSFSKKKIIAVFVSDSLTYDQVKKSSQSLGLEYYPNADDILRDVPPRDKSDYAAYPDSLMKFFIDKDIDYLILGRLRKIPNNKNAGIITTVQRYINFIELKYPQTFVPIKTFGEENNEPAYLLKVNYTSYQQVNKPQNEIK